MAVKLRAGRLKLGPYIEGGELVSFNVLCNIVMGETVKGYSYTLERFQRLGLPIKMVRVQQCQFRMVNVCTFWGWAYKHQSDLDFSRFEENALGAEPEWVKQKRKVDIENRRQLLPKKCAWSKDEEERLCWLIEHGATYADIEADLRRSSAAIRRKIYDLYLPHPKRCKQAPWNESELQQLVHMADQGYNHEYIASALHRSGQSVRGKIEFLKTKGLWAQYEQKTDVKRRSALPTSNHWQDQSCSW